MCDWLRRRRQLSIAIHVNIEEDSQLLNKIQSSEAFQQRAFDLLNRYGNSNGREKNEIYVEESDSRSDETLYVVTEQPIEV